MSFKDQLLHFTNKKKNQKKKVSNQNLKSRNKKNLLK